MIGSGITYGGEGASSESKRCGRQNAAPTEYTEPFPRADNEDTTSLPLPSFPLVPVFTGRTGNPVRPIHIIFFVIVEGTIGMPSFPRSDVPYLAGGRMPPLRNTRNPIPAKGAARRPYGEVVFLSGGSRAAPTATRNPIPAQTMKARQAKPSLAVIPARSRLHGNDRESSPPIHIIFSLSWPCLVRRARLHGMTATAQRLIDSCISSSDG